MRSHSKFSVSWIPLQSAVNSIAEQLRVKRWALDTLLRAVRFGDIGAERYFVIFQYGDDLVVRVRVLCLQTRNDQRDREIAAWVDNAPHLVIFVQNGIDHT